MNTEEKYPNIANYDADDNSFTNFCTSRGFPLGGIGTGGFNILTEEEDVKVEEIRGHGGFFKTGDVGKKIMATALNTPVSTLETAGEGGAWGMALLAAFMVRENRGTDLPGFLNQVFAHSMGEALPPDPTDTEGFNTFFRRYTEGLEIERAAVEKLRA